MSKFRVPKHGNTTEIRLWQVPVDDERAHGIKYSLVYISQSQRVVGYDNERGKGDHKHIDDIELPYCFTDLRQLKADFLEDVVRWKGKNYGNQG
jgi:hypothetical protein